jgi:hypothetical protein
MHAVLGTTVQPTMQQQASLGEEVAPPSMPATPAPSADTSTDDGDDTMNYFASLVND